MTYMYMHNLVIVGLHVCEFVYKLKFICNPQISTHDACLDTQNSDF